MPLIKYVFKYSFKMYSYLCVCKWSCMNIHCHIYKGSPWGQKKSSNPLELKL